MSKKEKNNRFGFLSEQDRLFPPMVVLEITTACNLSCIHCPHAIISKRADYSPRSMNWQVYKKIVEETASHTGTIFRFLADGEPLLHPRFLDMIRLAKSRKIAPLNFITNGTLLDEKCAQEILGVGVDVVEISIDAFSRQNYEKIRKGGDYEQVVANVLRLIALRNKTGASTKIMVSIIDQPEAAAEKEEFIKYWSSRADKVITRVYTSIGGLVDDSKLKIDTNGSRWPCPQLWRRMFINVDGLIEFCVEDWHDQTVVGDAKAASLSDVWRSPAYEKIRQLHLSKKFHEVSYCSACKDWKARDWDYDYFSALDQLLSKNKETSAS